MPTGTPTGSVEVPPSEDLRPDPTRINDDTYLRNYFTKIETILNARSKDPKPYVETMSENLFKVIISLCI
jgi:hypothetical protein